MAVKEAKTIRGHLVQEAEAACSKAICEAGALKISQAVMLHKEHGKYMQGLEEQAFGEESRSCNDFLSACQVALCHSLHCLKELWLLHITFYWKKHLHHLHSFCHRGLPLRKNSQPQPLLPHQCPNSPQGPKGDILHQSQWGACLWVEPPQRLCWEDPQPQKVRNPSWFKTLKPSCSEAFSQDSTIVIEARLEFSKNILPTSLQTAAMISPEHSRGWQ